jgi:hypothetical protein
LPYLSFFLFLREEEGEEEKEEEEKEEEEKEEEEDYNREDNKEENEEERIGMGFRRCYTGSKLFNFYELWCTTSMTLFSVCVDGKIANIERVRVPCDNTHKHQ